MGGVMLHLLRQVERGDDKAQKLTQLLVRQLAPECVRDIKIDYPENPELHEHVLLKSIWTSCAAHVALEAEPVLSVARTAPGRSFHRQCFKPVSRLHFSGR